MLKNLRGFSNTKLAGVLIAIIIVPFVFWGMGSVFSGGNTNNVAKINNKSISTQDFLQYVNQSRINLEYVKENIENNALEEILTGLVSNKLLEMEIESLNASFSENILANKIVLVSSTETLPFFSFLSGGLVNMFIPSGGGQWAVQGPVMIEAAEILGVNPSFVVLGVAYGDQWTNMIQPFWTIPLLAIAGLHMRQIMGYTFVIFIFTGFIFGGSLLFLGSYG